ncbi:S-methyl-5-thioribose-1-phosphate isomerase [Pseudomonas sp. 21LCFQ02]|uniref:S-methyl-5-thioribose-1-phosphate isomerase n=1 Tax=unclassified Pseudomonas TaxID=196821 RepID=UPI00209B3D33|nr:MULTISPECIES: S-methyl-5-thioribose-1-phosphate isomerase [unclassified Pseudomonas]MCO8168431.1 S-methyl-5-thioribose-1-phosphate isomerase [Pseudomonas sp. 21LCFQ02]MCQ9425130.1 S-methyl-5-thioribose-1-phosphate isomerase [Pseudomonas sp. LJDD11]
MRDQLLAAEKVKAIDWREDALYLLDQRVLPREEAWLACHDVQAVAAAISAMVVRGAQAIGVSAAYGVLLAARARMAAGGDWQSALDADFALLDAARPTAVNLSWALSRMRERLQRLKSDDDPLRILAAEAAAIHLSDRDANLTMAQLGAELIRKQQGNLQAVLTHGNAGALATGGFGTALGVIRAAHLEGMIEQVYVDETRPWLQGSRLTAWELASEGIPVSVIADSAAAHLMRTKGITWVVVGADRITANGDVAAKIGTYQLAVAAMHHGVRFMVVAPSSSIDMDTTSGDGIVLEERDGLELLDVGGQPLAARVGAFNPVFDVTPADLIDAIVTEKGVVERPDTARLAQLMSRKHLH